MGNGNILSMEQLKQQVLSLKGLIFLKATVLQFLDKMITVEVKQFNMFLLGQMTQ